MKSIFNFKIDLSQIKGAVKALHTLKSESFKTKDSLGKITEDLNKNVKTGEKSIGRLTALMSKLRINTGQVTASFRQFGQTIRNLTFNALGKFTNVLKGSLLIAGSVLGAVTGLFNAANGTTETTVSGKLSGLSYAEMKAHRDAQNETGLSLDLEGHKKGFNQGFDTEAAKSFMSLAGMDEKEFEKMRTDSNSYFKMNDTLYRQYQQILKNNGGDRNSAIGEFKAKFEDILSQFGYGDTSSFIQRNETGALSNYRQVYGDTIQAYKGVDVNSLLKGERALNKFSETLKAFGLQLSSQLLPELTEGLNNLTNLFKRLFEYSKNSGLLKNIAEAVGAFVELIIAIGDKIIGFISKLVGGDLTKYLNNFYGTVTNALKGTTALIKGDNKTADEHFDKAKSKGLETLGNIKKGVGNVIGEASASLRESGYTSTSDFIDRSREKGLSTAIGEQYESLSKKIEDKLGITYMREQGYMKPLNTQAVVNVNIDGKKLATVKSDYQIDPMQGIVNTGKRVED